MTVPPGGSTAADNPPAEPSADIAEGPWRQAAPGTTGLVPILSRAAHDRGHFSRARPDPTAGRPVRVLVVDPRRCAPIVEGADGPRLLWADHATMPEGGVYLGEADGMHFATVRGERSLRIGGRTVDTWSGLREVGAQLPDLDAGLLVEAIGILEWHERHRFSPLTGARTVVERAGWVQRDPGTGDLFFPRTDPAVIMLVHDGADRVVLGRQAVWPPGRFSILAGFVEPGESAESAVAREVAEEVGLAVTDVRYVTSQPWPFPQSLMLGFLARADGTQELRLDPDEIEEARWFTRDELRAGHGPQALPPPVSIARHILDRWVAGEF